MSEYRPFDIPFKGIDVRNELDELYNAQKTAHWVVYRRFDRTKRSDHFVPLTGEGVQGPKYEYTDELIETRMSLIRRLSPDMEVAVAPALVQNVPVIFFLKHTVEPKLEDVIYDTIYQGSVRPPSVPSPEEFVTKYNITAIFPMRDAGYGRIEYYLVYCKVVN